MTALHALEGRVPEGVGVVLAATGAHIRDGADFEAKAQADRRGENFRDHKEVREVVVVCDGADKVGRCAKAAAAKASPRG